MGDRDLMEEVRRASIELYSFAASHAREHGVILADTKFEFGLDSERRLTVGDEVLTPDSSRYWFSDSYAGRFEKGVGGERGVGCGAAAHQQQVRHGRGLCGGLRDARRLL